MWNGEKGAEEEEEGLELGFLRGFLHTLNEKSTLVVHIRVEKEGEDQSRERLSCPFLVGLHFPKKIWGMSYYD